MNIAHKLYWMNNIEFNTNHSIVVLKRPTI